MPKRLLNGERNLGMWIAVTGARVHRRTEMDRSQSFFGLLVIAATCAAGLLRAPWWAGVAGACLLALISLNLHAMEYARSAQSGDGVGQSSLLVASALNASAAAAAAFVTGRVLAWLWGV